jgi:hypothetical protein
MAASGHMRSCRFRQQRQTLLLDYDFHVLTQHDPALRESWRWMPAPFDFSQIVSAQTPDVPP